MSASLLAQANRCESARCKITLIRGSGRLGQALVAQMRALLHLLSVVLLLPSLFFSIAVALLSQATSQKSLLSFFLQLLEDAGNLLQWGFLVFIAFLVLIVGAGFSFRFRWLAGLVVALLAILSAALLIRLGSSPPTFDNMVFFLPGFISLCIGAWLAFTERPRIHSSVDAT